LRRALGSKSGTGALRHSWADDAPGAITIAADGRAWLADRSTGYRAITLAPGAIVHAEAISISTMRRGRAGPAFGVGVPMGGGLIATLSTGDKAPRLRVRHAVALHYRAEPNAPIRMTTVPFGSDFAGASAMATMLGRT
jgi:hypothetical protein